MRAIYKISLANLRKNRHRTIMTIIGAALSCMLILTTILIAVSFYDSIVGSQIEKYGNAHVVYENIPGDKLEIFESEPSIDLLFFAQLKPRSDATALLYADYVDSNRYQMYPAELNNVITNPIRESRESYNVFVRFKDTSPEAIEKTEKKIVKALDDAEVFAFSRRDNTALLVMQGNVDETTRLLLVYSAIIVLGFMAIMGIFIIRNSFAISVTERVRDFGILASVGASPRQIRCSVFFEAMYVAMFAIPIGILSSIGLSWLTLMIAQYLVSDSLEATLRLSIPWQALVAIVIVGIVILLLSSASAAIMAGRYSPIAAIRSTNEVKIRQRKIRTSKLIGIIFGIGGVIASKNLKRNRAKYRTTVISIVVSVAMFVGMSSFFNYMNKLIDSGIELATANITLVGNLSKDDFRKMAKNLELKDYGFAETVPLFAKGDYIMNIKLAILSRECFEKFALDSGYRRGDFANVAILGLQDSTKRSLGAGDTLEARVIRPEDYEAYMSETGGFLGGKTETTLQPITIQIDHAPTATFPGLDKSFPYVYISEDNELARKYSLNSVEPYRTSYLINDSGRTTDVKNYAKTHIEFADVDIIYEEEGMQNIRNTILFVRILLYGFILVIALIGATNIFNTIATNIASRAKEFAVLKSTGMTSREFSRMIRLESVLYSLRALLIGIPCGLLMTLFWREAFSSSDGQKAELLIPWLSICISVGAVLVLVFAVMHFSTRRVERQNIIETIRSESF